MSDYRDMSYRDLQVLCKERSLKASGSMNALIDRLMNSDLGVEPEKETPLDKAALKGLGPTDPSPVNPNYDLAGRWIRRDGDCTRGGHQAKNGRW